MQNIYNFYKYVNKDTLMSINPFIFDFKTPFVINDTKTTTNKARRCL